MNISIINESISCLTIESQTSEHLKDMLDFSIPEEIEGQICITCIYPIKYTQME